MWRKIEHRHVSIPKEGAIDSGPPQHHERNGYRRVACSAAIEHRVWSIAISVSSRNIFFTLTLIEICSHPLPILNISEHLTRLKLQKNSNSPFGLFSSCLCDL